MTISEVKQTLLNGKQLIANVVGGNSSSTFATLANNVQTIKNQRDQYKSQLDSKFERVSGSIAKSNTFSSQISYPFKHQRLYVNVTMSIGYPYFFIFNFADTPYLTANQYDGDTEYGHVYNDKSLVSGSDWYITDTYFKLLVKPVNGKSYCNIELTNINTNNKIVYYELYK